MFKQFLTGVAIAAVLMFGAVACSEAGTFSTGFEYQYFNGNSDTKTSNAIAVIPSYKMDNITVDARLQSGVTSGSDSTVFSTMEARGMYTLPMGNFAASARAGYGVAYEGSNSTAFYTIEPILAYKFTPKVEGFVSYRYIDSIGSADYGTNREELGVNYTLESKDVVSATGFYANDGFDGAGLKLAYTKGF